MKSGQTSPLYFVYFTRNAIHMVMVLMTHPLSDELMAGTGLREETARMPPVEEMTGTEDMVGRAGEEQTEVVVERQETSSSVVRAVVNKI